MLQIVAGCGPITSASHPVPSTPTAPVAHARPITIPELTDVPVGRISWAITTIGGSVAMPKIPRPGDREQPERRIRAEPEGGDVRRDRPEAEVSQQGRPIHPVCQDATGDRTYGLRTQIHAERHRAQRLRAARLGHDDRFHREEGALHEGHRGTHPEDQPQWPGEVREHDAGRRRWDRGPRSDLTPTARECEPHQRCRHHDREHPQGEPGHPAPLYQPDRDQRPGREAHRAAEREDGVAQPAPLPLSDPHRVGSTRRVECRRPDTGDDQEGHQDPEGAGEADERDEDTRHERSEDREDPSAVAIREVSERGLG